MKPTKSMRPAKRTRRTGDGGIPTSVKLTRFNYRRTTGEIDVDVAVLGVLRLVRKGTATHAAVNAMLLDLIGSDALRREVAAAVGGGHA